MILKTEYLGRSITPENRGIIEREISLICDIATRLNIPYKDGDNMTIETAITAALKRLLVESARKITTAFSDEYN